MSGARNELLLRLFDCLDGAERADLERRLQADEGARRTAGELERLAAEWARDREPHPSHAILVRLAAGTSPAAETAEALAHLLGCRDCRFEVAVLRADSEGSVLPEAPRRDRPKWSRRLLLAAAAVLGAALAGIGGYRIGGRSPAGPAIATSVLIDLETMRGQAESVDLRWSDLPGDGITLSAGIRVPDPGARWQLISEDGTVGAAGFLRFDPAAPRVRRIAVFVPRAGLSPGLWTFEAVTTDGTPVQRWWIRIQG